MVDCFLSVSEHELVLRVLGLVERADGFFVGVGEGDGGFRVDDGDFNIAGSDLIEARDDTRDGVFVGFGVDALLLQRVSVILIDFEVGRKSIIKE